LGDFGIRRFVFEDEKNHFVGSAFSLFYFSFFVCLFTFSFLPFCLFHPTFLSLRLLPSFSFLPSSSSPPRHPPPTAPDPSG
jgi:hypothetical protein